MTFNWNTNRTSGLKNLTFGFIVNKTGSWDDDIYANGVNSTTSYMGALAWETDGINVADLEGSRAYDYAPWKSVVGYQSGMISTFGGNADRYVGASELVFDNGDIVLGGALDQTYGRRVVGSKYDYVFNFGGNVSDFVYFGVNLGITSLNYGYDEYFKEEAIDPADFEIGLDNGETMYFSRMKHRYSYEADGSGYYAKFGVIVTPGAGFRFGAAIQTPTLNTITERWQENGETEFTVSKFNGFASSPEGEYSYTFRSPFRANFGLAYTLGSFAVISADYELCNYGQMQFRTNGSDRDYFEDINNDIKSCFGTSHMLRAGAEVKIGALAARVGYGMTSSAEKNRYEVPKGVNPKYCTQYELISTPTTYNHNISFGFGYSSKGSFFADIAVRTSMAIDEYDMPYSDYILNEDDDYSPINPAPKIMIHRSNWKVLLTLGWRF
jgi:hypothetical protein